MRQLPRPSDASGTTMIEVGRFQTRAEAEHARSLLAAAGIPAVLAPSESGEYRIDPSGGASLFVADVDAAHAARILSRQTRTDDE